MNDEHNELQEDLLALIDKHSSILPKHRLGYELIKLSVKMLMDLAPRHKIAIDTIRMATDEGLMWHVEERKDQNKGRHYE